MRAEFCDFKPTSDQERRRLWFFSGGITSMFLAFLVVVACMILLDVDPPDSSQFEIASSSVSAGGNPFDEFRHWTFTQHPRIHQPEVLFEAELWRRVDELLKMPSENWRTPPVLFRDERDLRGYAEGENLDFNLSDLGRWGSHKAAYLISQGRFDEAVEHAMKLVDLGFGMTRADADARVYSWGVKIFSDGFHSLANTMHANDGIQPLPVLRRIEGMELNFGDLQRSLRVEFQRFNGKLKWSRNNGKGFLIECDMEPWLMKPQDYRIKPNLILCRIVEEWRPFLEIDADWQLAREKIKLSKPSSLAPILLSESWWERWINRENGRRAMQGISNEFTWPMKCLIQQSLLAMLWQRMAMCQLALRAYEQDNGRLPETLDALVPAYLSASMRDPFSESDINWNPKMRYLYSAGWDGVDDGGRIEKGEWLWPEGLDRSVSSDSDTDLGMKYWWDTLPAK